MIGIYCIKNTVNGKCYVGSSRAVGARIKQHLSDLVTGTHPNKFLQTDWIEYGCQNFSFVVLEKCDDLIRFEREQFYIDTLTSSYNICKIAGSNIGLKHSKETKEKISKVFAGKKQSAEQIQKRANAKKRKIVRTDHNGVEVVFDSLKDVCNQFDYTESMIINCYKGRTPHAYGFKWKQLSKPTN